MEKEKSKKTEKRTRMPRVDGRTIKITAVVVLIVALFTTITVLINRQSAIAEDFFVSDGSKLVVNLDADESGLEEGEYKPGETHIVYFYSGDEVTNAEVYFEYADANAAREAFGEVSLADKNWALTKKLNGKYIVWQVKQTSYEGITVEGLKESVEKMRAAGIL